MTSFSERRQTIRIAVHGNLLIESVSPGVSLGLIDVGTGGFAVRSRVPIPLDVAAGYRISTPDRKWSAIFRARALHCKILPAVGAAGQEYMTGFTFVNADSPAVQREVMAMMDHAMNFVSFS